MKELDSSRVLGFSYRVWMHKNSINFNYYFISWIQTALITKLLETLHEKTIKIPRLLEEKEKRII